MNNEISYQFKAIWALQGIWRRYRNTGVVMVPTSDGLEYIDMAKSYPADAVKFLHSRYNVPYEVVNRWCSNIDIENALA